MRAPARPAAARRPAPRRAPLARLCTTSANDSSPAFFPACCPFPRQFPLPVCAVCPIPATNPAACGPPPSALFLLAPLPSRWFPLVVSPPLLVVACLDVSSSLPGRLTARRDGTKMAGQRRHRQRRRRQGAVQARLSAPIGLCNYLLHPTRSLGHWAGPYAGPQRCSSGSGWGGACARAPATQRDQVGAKCMALQRELGRRPGSPAGR